MLEVFKPAQRFANKLKHMITAGKKEGRFAFNKEKQLADAKHYVELVKDPEDKKDAEALFNKAKKCTEALERYDEKKSKEMYEKFVKSVEGKSDEEIQKLYDEYEYKMDLLISGYNSQIEEFDIHRDKLYHLATGKFYGESHDTSYNTDNMRFIIECVDIVEDAPMLKKFGNINYETITHVKCMRDAISTIPEHIKNRDFNALNTEVLNAIKCIDILINNIENADVIERGYYKKVVFDLVYPTVALFATVVRNSSDMTIRSLQELIEDLKSDMEQIDVIENEDLINNPFIYKYKDVLIKRLTEFKIILGDFSDTVYALFEAKKAVLDKETYDATIESVFDTFNSRKAELYTECSNGTITLYEREEKIQDLKDTRYLATILTRDVYESATNKKMYNGIIKTLYERCAAGELSLDERERLVMKAKRELIFESDDSKIPAANDTTMGKEPDEAKTKKNQEKATEDFEKDIDKIGE